MRGEKTKSFAPSPRHIKTLRAWHLSLLRFALTLENSDRQQVIAAAREIDQMGLSSGGWVDFRYFRTLSEDLCRALADQNSPPSPLLRSYIAKIEDLRIRHAFAAAAGLDNRHNAVSKASKSRDTLWRGLTQRKASTETRGCRQG